MDAVEPETHEKPKDVHDNKDGGSHPSSEREHKKKKLDVNIREMEIDDIPEVFHLGELIFTAQEAPNLYRTWDEYEVTSLFNSDSEYCMVAEFDRKIVGFALGTTVTKNKSSWKYGYLIWLGTSPDYRREGIASRLFDKLAEKMIEDGARMFLVDTEASDLPALQLFEKKGFGNPQKHIYLTLNLRTYQRLQKKRDSGRKQKEGSSCDRINKGKS